MKAPARLLISAAASSSGKTTLSLLILAWARKQGIATSAFKCGPDFIDRQYLERLSGRPAHNLDAWMAGPVAKSFDRGLDGSALAVIEGVMGLYDGKRGAAFGRYSSAEISKALRCPVVVVLNAKKSGVTLATQLLGLQKADPSVLIVGAVLDQVSGAKAYELIAPAVRRLCKVPVFGWLPYIKDLELPERHLGLQAASEIQEWEDRFRAGLEMAEKTIDFRGLWKAARRAPPWELRSSSIRVITPITRVRIAIAKDQAFHFYYPANLKALENAGAELVPFSPLADRALPKNIQGLLLGGGFPEIFGKELQSNRRLRAEIQRRVKEGLCTWAECGGLMYLCASLTDLAGERWRMAGALKAQVRMTSGLKNFGYSVSTAVRDSPVLTKGASLRGHEFHHSEIQWDVLPRSGWNITQTSRPSRQEGFLLPNGVATYLHAHLGSNSKVASRFVDACARGGSE